MLLFFDFSGLEWMVFNFFMLTGSAAVLVIALIVALIAKSNNNKAFKQQGAFGVIKGALIPFIGGGLGMCAHPDFFDQGTRRAMDDAAPFYTSVTSLIMLIVIVVHFKRKRPYN